MERIELLDMNKNKILNFAVIILALFIAFQIYKSAEKQVNTLVKTKEIEVKKNVVTEELADLEGKLDGYKKIFVKRNMGSIVETISNIAKSNSVNIVSVKPLQEEVKEDYVKSSFLMTISSPDYHSLGNFISQIESNNDIFIVGEININAPAPGDAGNANANLNVSLEINTISY